DLPILGNLFKSTEFRKGQTELVIVVTPYLVNPVDANDIKLPTDGFRASTTMQQLFGGQENDGVTGGDRPKPTAVGDGANAPKVSLEDYDASPGDKDRPRDAKAGRSAQADPAPGFSLK
ncbi:MAG: type and secretion system protein family protein, partial [Proteobacteria bacterium]|nr:type and secretion system protein family protein [Pseudomonadota bacterium]